MLRRPYLLQWDVKTITMQIEQDRKQPVLIAKQIYPLSAKDTVNYELGRFKAVFNKLIELGEWKLPNPIENVKPFKESEHEMAFLTHEQIVKLLTYAEHHKRADMIKIIKLCLSTGARWNEAAQLRGSQVSQFKVTFTKTKTKKNRTVPISEELYKEINKPTSGPLFEECYTPFCYILKKQIRS
jgi:integrase